MRVWKAQTRRIRCVSADVCNSACMSGAAAAVFVCKEELQQSATVLAILSDRVCVCTIYGHSSHVFLVFFFFLCWGRGAAAWGCWWFSQPTQQLSDGGRENRSGRGSPAGAQQDGWNLWGVFSPTNRFDLKRITSHVSLSHRNVWLLLRYSFCSDFLFLFLFLCLSLRPSGFSDHPVLASVLHLWVHLRSSQRDYLCAGDWGEMGPDPELHLCPPAVWHP